MSVIKCSRSARDEISVIKCWRCSAGRVRECCQDTWGTCCEDLLFPVSIEAPKSVRQCCLWRNSDERCWSQQRFGFLHVCEPPVQSCLLRSLVSSIFWSLPCSAVAVESLKKKEDIHVCCFGLFSLKVSLKTRCSANPRKFGSVATWLILHLKTCTSATPVRCCPCCGKQSPGGVHKLQLWLKATLTWERRPSQMGHPYLKITVFRKMPLFGTRQMTTSLFRPCMFACVWSCCLFFLNPVLLLHQTFHCKVLFEGWVLWRLSPLKRHPDERPPQFLRLWFYFFKAIPVISACK